MHVFKQKKYEIFLFEKINPTRITLIFITISIQLILSINEKDFCIKKEKEFYGNYSLICESNVCAKDRNSCRDYTLLRTLKNMYKFEKESFI